MATLKDNNNYNKSIAEQAYEDLLKPPEIENKETEEFMQLCQAVYDSPAGRKLLDILADEHRPSEIFNPHSERVTNYNHGRAALIYDIISIAKQRGSK